MNEDEEPTNLSRRRSRSNPPQGYVQSNAALRDRFGTRKIGNGPAQFSDRDTTPSARAVLPGSNQMGGRTDNDTWDRFFNKRAYDPTKTTAMQRIRTNIASMAGVSRRPVSSTPINAPGLARSNAPAPTTGAASYLDRIIGDSTPGYTKSTRSVFGDSTMDEYNMEDGGTLRSLTTPYGSVNALTPGSIGSRLRRNNLGYSPLT